MKRVTNTYKEPLVISLLVKTPGKTEPDRAQFQLPVGGHMSVLSSMISPELALLYGKGRVSIEDVDTKPRVFEFEIKEQPSKDEPMGDEEIKKLEQELLQEDPQEG